MCFLNVNSSLSPLSLQDSMQPLTLQRLVLSNKIVVLLMFCLWNIIKRIFVVFVLHHFLWKLGRKMFGSSLKDSQLASLTTSVKHSSEFIVKYQF